MRSKVNDEMHGARFDRGAQNLRLQMKEIPPTRRYPVEVFLYVLAGYRGFGSMEVLHYSLSIKET